MSSVVIAGDTSGTVTLDAPAVAGTTVLTLPATSGTVLTSASSVSASSITGTLPVANGGTGLTSVGTSGNVLTSNGTTWTSAALPAGGVTSLNGQTGAITTNTFNSIGSSSGLFTQTAISIDSTVAGSTLRKINSAGSFTAAGATGTWRNMGGNEFPNNMTVLIRIS